MNWPFLKKKKDEAEYYLGLFLKENEGYVLVISFANGNAVIVEREKFSYTNGWENLGDDVDEVLYRVEKKLGFQLKKTIFFVYSHLIDEKALDIKKPYLQKIKELVKNLELEALGYIECFEAVSSYLHKKNEIPLTGILVELDKNSLSLFVYKGGKSVHRATIARSDDIIADLMEGFKDVKGKTLLPAKIIPYDSGSLDSAIEKIITHHWSEEYFIQLPKVDVFSEENVFAALVDIFSKQVAKRIVPVAETEINKPEEAFGFVVNADISETKNPEPEVKVSAQEITKRTGDLKKSFAGLLGIFSKLKRPKFNLSGQIFLIIGVVIVLGALFLNEYFFHKAELQLYLPSKSITKNSTFSIGYVVASESANFVQTATTTGKKDIGSPAKGEVTIRNFDDTSKTFSQGTILSANNLNFTLDTDVQVAASTIAPDGSAKLPGTAQAAVTAQDIGSQGNLVKGTHFAIDNLSTNTYFAINDNDFTGGSKKTVQTVSKSDEDGLEKAVIAKAQGQEQLKSAPGIAVPSLTETSLVKTAFSKEVGEEASSVTLSATAVTTYYLYDKSNLLSEIASSLQGDVPSGYVIAPGHIYYQIKKVDKSGGLLDLSLSVQGEAVKEVSVSQVLSAVVFKNKSVLGTILKDKFSAQGYNVKIKEPLPILNDFMPIFKRNISLTTGSL